MRINDLYGTIYGSFPENGIVYRYFSREFQYRVNTSLMNLSPNELTESVRIFTDLTHLLNLPNLTFSHIPNELLVACQTICNCLWQCEVKDICPSIHLLHPTSISFHLHLQRRGTLNRTADAETAAWLLMQGSLPALDTFHLRWLRQLSRSVHSQPVSGHSSPTLSRKSDQSIGTAVPHSSSLQSKLPSLLWIQD